MNVRRVLISTLRSLRLLRFVRWAKRRIAGTWKDLVWTVGRKSAKWSGGLAIPPPSLCFAVSANYDIEYFLRTGAQGAESITRILSRNGRPIGNFRSLLDFGCGCGRITRHLVHLDNASITGVDVDTKLVDWARRRLPFGRFLANGMRSSLPFSDGEFDFVFAISVFTHLREDLQRHWMAELMRVLHSDGVLLLTVKGENWQVELKQEQIDRFRNGQLVVVEPENAGSNYCGAYHPQNYVLSELARGLRLLEHEPCGSKDTRQDFYLFTKCAQA